MEALGQLMLKIYTDFGLLLTLVILALCIGGYEIICGLSRFASGLLRTKFPELYGKKKLKLSKHVVFSKLDTLLNYRISNIHIICPLRSKIFTDLLTYRVTAVRDVLMDFVKADVDAMAQADFRQAVADRLQAIEYAWTAKSLKEGIPAVALDRFKEYNSKWANTLDEIILDQCLVTTAYQHNSDRLDSILDMIGSFEVHCFSDVEKALASINGELSGAVYKGAQCFNCTPDCELTPHKKTTKETADEKAV